MRHSLNIVRHSPYVRVVRPWPEAVGLQGVFWKQVRHIDARAFDGVAFEVTGSGALQRLDDLAKRIYAQALSQ